MGIFGKKTDNEMEKKVAVSANESANNIASPVAVPDANLNTKDCKTESEQQGECPAVEKEQTYPVTTNNETIKADSNSGSQTEAKENNDKQNEKESFEKQNESSKECDLLNEEEKCRIYSLVFQYGCLSEGQIRKAITKQSISKLDEMEAVTVQEETVYFHTEESLRTYSELSGEAYQEMKKDVVFSDQVEQAMMPDILEENEILLAYEGASKKPFSVYDWVSSKNPRKKRPIKIQRCDGKRGSLAPDLAIVFQKQSLQYCLIIEILPAYSAYMPGEKSERYWDTIGVYHSFLLSQEEKEKWIQKVKLDVLSDNIGVALIFSTTSALILDLVGKMKRSEITTPVYLGRMEDVLKRPFSGWYSCYKNGLLLKIQKQE